MTEKTFKPFPDGGKLRATISKRTPLSPDYWGDIAINLKDTTGTRVEDGLTIFKLSGWKKVDSSGKTYLSLSVDRYVPEAAQAPVNPQAKRQVEESDDDEPF
jgi:hypothetical protein